MKQRKRSLMIAIAGFALAAVAPATPTAASNAIYLKCSSESPTGVDITRNDLTESSIGEELADLPHPSQVTVDQALVLSYSEAAQSTPLHDGGGDYTHGGLTIVRPVANSSPKFMKALFLGEVWAGCTLDFYRKGSSGFEYYLEIKIEEVNVVQVEPRAVTQFESAGTGKNHLEAITFIFQRIKWKWHSGDLNEFSFNLETGEQGP